MPETSAPARTSRRLSVASVEGKFPSSSLHDVQKLFNHKHSRLSTGSFPIFTVVLPIELGSLQIFHSFQEKQLTFHGVHAKVSAI